MPDRGAFPRLKNTLTAALALCLLLLIVGAKWATFGRYGSPMPDWDQWDAEAMELFVPWFTNDEFLKHLFNPHNEHRIVLTKLQNLAVVLLNGQWDSRLEAVVNAPLHAALGVAFWLAGCRWSARRWHAPLFVLAAALFGLPLAWQNVLGGFHSQQYWLLGLSFAALLTLPFARAWSGAWWLGAAGAVLALGSMGSGFLAAAVVLPVVGWRLLGRETTLRAAWPALALALLLVTVGLLTRHEVPWHAELKAKTVHDFVFSLVHSLQWPLHSAHWAALVLWLPWLVVATRVARNFRRPASRDNRIAQTLAALGGWVLVQLVATAYARGANADYPASRYMDTLAFGTMVNALALAWWLSTLPAGRAFRVGAHAVGLGWVVTLGFGLHQLTVSNLTYDLPDARAKYYDKAESNLRRYLATDDPRELAYPEIPFPSAPGLVERLAIPSLRALMPVPVRTPVPMTPDPAAGSAGFHGNRALGSHFERPPKLGLSPETGVLDYTPTWGSFAPTGDGRAATGRWTSAPLPTPQFRWLKFEVAGDLGRPGAGVSVALHDAASGALLAELHPTRIPGDTWRSVYVRSPRAPFVVKAVDASATQWVALSPPVEMGGGSYWARNAGRHGLLLAGIAAVAALGLGICGLVWRREPTPPARPV